MTSTPANSFLRGRLLFSSDSRWQHCKSLSFHQCYCGLGSSFLQSASLFRARTASIGKITKMTKIFLASIASLCTLHLITQLKSLS